MKKMFKWLMILTLTISMVASFSLIGCNAGAAEEVEETVEEVVEEAKEEATEEIVEEATEEEAKEAGEVVELNFWHAMSGTLADAVIARVEAFNSSQDKIHVSATFQGTYDDAFTKLKASMLGNVRPDIVQIYDIGTNFMIDSGYIYPMQNFIDADTSFDASQLEPNLLGYYTVEGKLYSMPFNASTPIVFFNKTAVEEAGLDLNTMPANFSDIEEYARALTYKDDSGVTHYGFSIVLAGWFFEQWLAKEGINYVNNGNGRTARATEVAWGEGEGFDVAVDILTNWKKGCDEGWAVNYGRNYDDGMNAFFTGNIGMLIESSGSVREIQTGIGDRFEVFTAIYPQLTDRPSSDKGGIIIGGASLWAIETKDEAKKAATWEFIKFLASPEQQFNWNKDTGYFPITKGVYDLPEMTAHLEENPIFKTAVDQLHQTPLTEATSGGYVGVFAEARATIEKEIELVLEGSKTPEAAVADAVAVINEAITNYNAAIE